MPCTLKQGEKSTIDVGKEQQGRRDGAEDLVDRRFCVGGKSDSQGSIGSSRMAWIWGCSWGAVGGDGGDGGDPSLLAEHLYRMKKNHRSLCIYSIIIRALK